MKNETKFLTIYFINVTVYHPACECMFVARAHIYRCIFNHIYIYISLYISRYVQLWRHCLPSGFTYKIAIQDVLCINEFHCLDMFHNMKSSKNMCSWRSLFVW